MIATLAEIKTFLQISGSTYDTLINALIVPTQDWLVNHLKNAFLDRAIWYASSEITIAANSIVDADSQFVENDFVAGDYLIEGSKYNQAEYKGQIVNISTVAAGTLSVNSTYYTLIPEAADNIITLTRVVFPNGLKMPFSQLIKQEIDDRNLAIESFSLADYSVKYANDAGVGNFPQGILNRFNPWKKVYW